MNWYIKKILPVIVFLLAISSCENDGECRKDKYVVVKMGFYQSTLNETTSEYTVSSLSIDSITVQGIGNDSVLYNNAKSKSEIDLPLNPNGNQTSYRVVFNETADTITILHQDTLQYLSLECGCLKTFVIDTVLTTNNFIDSVKISNYTVNTTDAEHIKIYH